LSDALADIHWAVATSVRSREKDSGYSRPILNFVDALEKVNSQKAGQRWAIVLGPEDHGLSDAELSQCHCLTCIDTTSESPSMNVAMAAGCLLYHWSLTKKVSAVQQSDVKELASAGDVEKLCQFIFETVKLSEFFKYPDEVAVLARLRRLFQSEEALTRGDVLFAFEIFYQLRSKILGHFESRNFLK
jgi:tRNA C32,U32 (ribose-2'-O)-methylase TrmJ